MGGIRGYNVVLLRGSEKIVSAIVHYQIDFWIAEHGLVLFEKGVGGVDGLVVDLDDVYLSNVVLGDRPAGHAGPEAHDQRLLRVLVQHQWKVSKHVEGAEGIVCRRHLFASVDL